MKKILTLACFILAAIMVKAQTPAKSFYVELGGPGLASINYDMRFAPKEDGLGFRVGLGGFSFWDESFLTVPLGLNYLLSKDKKNYFEIGAGATIVSSSSDGDETLRSTFGHLSFGYRLQPENGGFLFRAAIVPVFNSEGFVPYYAGIAFSI
jgi:hypothetical protein